MNNEMNITPEVIITEFGLFHNESIDRITTKGESIIYCDTEVFITGQLNINKSFYHNITINYFFNVSDSNITLNTYLTGNNIICVPDTFTLKERHNARVYNYVEERGNLLKMLYESGIVVLPSRVKQELYTEYFATYLYKGTFSIFDSFNIAEKIEEVINQVKIDSNSKDWTEINPLNSNIESP